MTPLCWSRPRNTRRSWRKWLDVAQLRFAARSTPILGYKYAEQATAGDAVPAPHSGNVRYKEMITQTKLNEYLWANGDIDGYARSGRDGDISTDEWFSIDRLLSAITIIHRGLAAPEFKQRHYAEVAQLFDSETTYQQLVEFQRKSEQSGRDVLR